MKDQPIEHIIRKNNMTLRICSDIFFLDFWNNEIYITSINIKIKKYWAGAQNIANGFIYIC
jgi:hypothetical protein